MTQSDPTVVGTPETTKPHQRVREGLDISFSDGQSRAIDAIRRYIEDWIKRLEEVAS